MNKKQTIRLNENQLKRIIKESVKRVLNEEDIDYDSLTPFQKSHLSMSGVDLKGSQFDNVLFDITIEVLSKLHNFDPIDKPNFADDYPNEFEAAYRAAQMGYDYAKKNKTPRGWTHILTGYPNEY